MAADAFGHDTESLSARESCLQGDDDTDDPVLRALRAAPWAPISEEELAELEEAYRSTTRWIPADEFMAFVETLRDQQQDVED